MTEGLKGYTQVQLVIPYMTISSQTLHHLLSYKSFTFLKVNLRVEANLSFDDTYESGKIVISIRELNI